MTDASDLTNWETDDGEPRPVSDIDHREIEMFAHHVAALVGTMTRWNPAMKLAAAAVKYWRDRCMVLEQENADLRGLLAFQNIDEAQKLMQEVRQAAGTVQAGLTKLHDRVPSRSDR